jgi:hypothetical protein
MLLPERIKQIRLAYRHDMNMVEANLTEALCEAYKEITGKQPSTKFEEMIAQAIRCEGL